MKNLRVASLGLEERLNKVKKKQTIANEPLIIDGGRYFGEYVKYQNATFRHGLGEMLYSDGVYYKGQFSCDTRHGIGTLGWENGNTYLGEWVFNFPCGKGKFYIASSEKLFDEFWFNGVVLRIANTYTLENAASLSRNTSYVFKDWHKFIDKYEKPPYGIYTTAFFSTLVEKLNEDDYITLLEFCEKWELQINQCETVIALFDIEEGGFRNMTLSLYKTGYLEKMISRYLYSGEKEEIIRRVFAIFLLGSNQKQLELIKFIYSKVPEKSRSHKFIPQWISRLLECIKQVSHCNSACLKAGLITLEEFIKEKLETPASVPAAASSDTPQNSPQLSSIFALPLLRLYDFMKNHYLYEDRVKILTAARTQLVNNEVAEGVNFIKEIADYLFRLIDEIFRDFLAEQRGMVELLKSNTDNEGKVNDMLADILKWNQEQFAKMEIHLPEVVEAAKALTPEDIDISESLFATFERIWEWASPKFAQPRQPRFRPQGLRKFRKSVLYEMDISRPIGLVNTHAPVSPTSNSESVTEKEYPSPLNLNQTFVSYFANVRRPTIPPDVKTDPQSAPCFYSIVYIIDHISPLSENAHSLAGALIRSQVTELIEYAITLLDYEIPLTEYFNDTQLLKDMVVMVYSFLIYKQSPDMVFTPPGNYNSSSLHIDKLRSASLYLLSKLASKNITDSVKELITAHLGLNPIAEILQSQQEFLQIDALELIVALASGSSAIREQLAQYFLQTVIEKLKSGKTDQIRSAAARAVANLCYNVDNKEILVSQGALSSLLEFTKQGQVQINNAIKQEELTMGPLLGIGTFARVHKGVYKSQDVAIKVFSESSLAFRLEDFYKEVAIMCILNHPNIVGFEGACIERKRDDESVFMIVTELMEKGTLKDQVRETPLSPSQTVKYAIDIAKAMEYIHHVEIIHRDLKCDNVLLNKDDIAKVADLGLAREIDIDNGMTVLAGTPKWEAPEVLVSKKGKRNYSKSADVYSFGMVLYEMMSGLEPFPDIHDIFELKKIVCDKNKRPKLPKKKLLNPALISMMKECWQRDPNRRPSFSQILIALKKIDAQ